MPSSFPLKIFLHISDLLHECYMPDPSYPLDFDNCDNT